MSEFLYLYRGGQRETSPEKMQQQMQTWMTWLKDLAAKGHVKDQGQPLERAGKVVKGRGKTNAGGLMVRRTFLARRARLERPG